MSFEIEIPEHMIPHIEDWAAQWNVSFDTVVEFLIWLGLAISSNPDSLKSHEEMYEKFCEWQESMEGME